MNQLDTIEQMREVIDTYLTQTFIPTLVKNMKINELIGIDDITAYMQAAFEEVLIERSRLVDQHISDNAKEN